MNISLSDFRNVLGVKNDGNVVLTLDKGSVEKADYGNFFSNMFRHIRTSPNDPNENREIRKALMKAIEASVEGKVLSNADMIHIKTELGLNNDAEEA